MMNNVIRVTHEKLGHLTSDKCCTRIKKNYWFPYMKSYINNIVRHHRTGAPYEIIFKCQNGRVVSVHCMYFEVMCGMSDYCFECDMVIYR